VTKVYHLGARGRTAEHTLRGSSFFTSNSFSFFGPAVPLDPAVNPLCQLTTGNWADREESERDGKRYLLFQWVPGTLPPARTSAPRSCLSFCGRFFFLNFEPGQSKCADNLEL